ncbi:hypothetical protein [Bradyrhizobium sp. 27S5]|uniref:hypothetical protein n=1 Tax=Bradyrhizobium sp. 27S5 TaxID=3139728 RepID=UPI0030D62518
MPHVVEQGEVNAIRDNRSFSGVFFRERQNLRAPVGLQDTEERNRELQRFLFYSATIRMRAARQSR